ncbi:sigma-70 family RNA polymerase sigma factor [Chitinophaga varians]|uniref:Sigma-70 family RNA polymerase sigma factor n=1 Tax=Chitinophaga varians TaxID=2202339 RepID=A0A847S4T0_9BACT|nr:sigma-70 family RNA polymerase sigma factor [Chitinophaga varians]NLR67847.1 sigma-70 family RNA polymerase sigma factor [Chitinophaga varians]
MQELEDIQLLHQLREGDEHAFTTIYKRYWKLLFSVAANKLDNLEEAEELVQDIFSDLWDRRETLALTGALPAYLAVATKYRVINLQARKKRAKAYSSYARENISPEDHSTEQWLRFEDLKGLLSGLVAALPERCRLTYQLSREMGLSHKEIAQRMNISEKAVEHNLARAVKTLKSGLKHLSALFFTVLP